MNDDDDGKGRMKGLEGFRGVETFSAGDNMSREAMRAVAVVIAIWVLAGFIAFVYSIVCFAKSGTPAEKALGLLLALLFGPFYWVYYALNTSYCR